VVKWGNILLLIALLASAFYPVQVQAAPAPAPAAYAVLPNNTGLSLDGVNSYLRVANQAELNPTSAITIEAWVYRNDASRCETVVGKNFSSAYWLGICSGKIRFYPRGVTSYVDGNAPILANTWTHIAVTYDGTTRRYYVNGVLDLESTLNNGPLTTSTAALGIGYDPSTSFAQNYFSGRLDEVRIWNVVRSQEEIRFYMYQFPDSGAPGLVGNWSMNNAAFDSSGAGNHGTVQGGAVFTPLGVIPRVSSIQKSPAAVTVSTICKASSPVLSVWKPCRTTPPSFLTTPDF
jgi:hypothetical protein